MDKISNYGAPGVSQFTDTTTEKPRIRVPGQQASHQERQAFIDALLPPGRQRFTIGSLEGKQLARFVAYFRIKGVDANDAGAVARFINGYEQYCGEMPQPDRDSLVASLKDHIAMEPNAAALAVILNENTEQFADLLADRAPWDFLNLPDRDGYTPLMRAVEENDTELVKDLLQHGAEVDHRTLMPSKNGTSLMALIAERGDFELLDRVSKGCERPSDLLKAAADGGHWGVLRRILDSLKGLNEKTPIPVPLSVLEAAVSFFKPALRDPDASNVLVRMFREVLVNRDLKHDDKRESYQLLVDLAAKDRGLAVAILSPLTKVGLRISHILNFDVPELIGLLVAAGADIHEHVGNFDLLVTAIDNDLSLATIEALLKAYTAAGVPWNHDECLNSAMNDDSVPLAGLLLAYGARPNLEVETWFYEHAD